MKERLKYLSEIGLWAFRKEAPGFFSPGMYHLLSLPFTSEAQIETLLPLMPEEDRKNFQNSALYFLVKNWTLPNHEEDILFEFRIHSSSGIKYLRGRGMIYFDNHHLPVAVEGHLEDISRFKLRDKKNWEHQGRLALMGEAASNIVHEINTPLSIMAFYSEYLIKNMGEKTLNEEKLLSHLATIHRVSHRVSKIISGMKSLMVSGEGAPFELTTVKEIIDETLILCQDRLKWAEVSVDLDIPQGLKIECRSFQIGQILTNLVINSVNSIQAQKEKWIRISAKIKDEIAIIQILDSGHGIPKEISNHIMKPFFTTRTAEGTGLGLAISQDLAHLHHGKLYYEPHSSHTLFVLELPLRLNKMLPKAV